MPASLGESARSAQAAEDGALAYFESVRRAFDRARRRAGCFEQSLQLGEVSVHLRFAGRELLPVLLPALSPVLRAGSSRADATVELWEESTTGVGIPPPFWRLRDVIARGDVRSLSGGRIRAQVDSGNRILTMWDTEERRGIVWAGDAHRLPWWVRATPLRLILHWSLAGPRRHLLHAAAIGDGHVGALLAGRGGSGKSTTALACLQAGLGYAGDDYVLAEIDPSPRALSVYGTGKLDPASLKLLPALPARQLTPEAPKLVVDVAETRPQLMLRSVAISVLVLPQVRPGRLALRPATAAEALRALAPSTILQHADESGAGMALMAALVRQVPVYRLELGDDIARVAPAIRELLEASR